MTDNKTVSLHLALHPKATLLVSLFSSQDPYAVANKVKDHDSRFAIVDASRIISLNQIVVAANMALQRRSREPVAFDIVLAAAGSTHAGHVTRDYAFGEQQDDSSLQEEQEGAMVLALGLDCSMEEFHSMAKQVGLGDPQPFTCFSDPPSEEQTTNFVKWYKLTKEEVEMSSLEKAVLTRIATKYL